METLSGPSLTREITQPRNFRLRGLYRRALLIIPVLCYAAIALVTLAANYWSTEQGAHGPLILISGLWLLWYRMPEAQIPRPSTRRDVLAAAGIIALGGLGVLSAILVKQFIQITAMYGVLVLLLYRDIGLAGIQRLWAPLVYLAFLIPPPENLIVPITHAAKVWVAATSVATLFAFDYPVAQDGPLLFIGPYELVVAAACSGLNSLVSLSALSIFYIYLRHRSDWRYSLVLSMLVIPIALVANLARVIAVLLVTIHFGEAAGLGVLHDALGLILFATALALLVGADAVLYPLLAGRRADSE